MKNEIIYTPANKLEPITKTGKLQLSPITVNEAYRKEWQITSNDFVMITRDGEIVNDSLFRVGGLGDSNISDKKYFTLLKHNEAFYSADIMKHSKSKTNKHLESISCIIDNNGVVKYEAQQFHYPYIIKDSCIFSIDGKYYNIETGYFYGESSNSMVSDDYIFLNNQFDNDKSKRGVIKINKQDGTFELFKGK